MLYIIEVIALTHWRVSEKCQRVVLRIDVSQTKNRFILIKDC